MKKYLLLPALTAVTAAIVLSSYSTGPAANGQGNRTVAGCGGSGCHLGGANSATSVSVMIMDGSTQVTSYVPYRNYTVHISGTNTLGSHPKFGFQVIAIQGTNTNMQAGTFTTGGTPGIAVRTGIGVLELVEHATALNGTTASFGNGYDISFNWKAPYPTFGPVTFRCVLNAVNGNGVADAGDVCNFATLQLPESNVGVAGLRNSISFSLYPLPAKDQLHLQLIGTTIRNGQATVYDITGRQLLRVPFTGSETSLDVQALAAGMYQVVITDGQGYGAMRFVK